MKFVFSVYELSLVPGCNTLGNVLDVAACELDDHLHCLFFMSRVNNEERAPAGEAAISCSQLIGSGLTFCAQQSIPLPL